ncbi:MAG: protein disulfide oxidoreductase [Desulfatibacillaceae bacterium]
MEEFFDKEAKEEVKGVLEKLLKPVRVLFFKQKLACPSCQQQQALLTEFADLSKAVRLEVLDTETHADMAREYGIDKVPATVVEAREDYGIRFYGLTAGYEFSSLMEAVVRVSTGQHGLEQEVLQLLSAIDVPVHLEIMVTVTCPYCPRMVHIAHQMAMANENIRADMVESSEFPHLVQRYDVSGVPRTVINGIPSFEGAVPAEAAALEIIKVAKPRLYEKIDARMREERGERKARDADPGKEYDVMVIGAGPAAMNAVIYAKRKNLEVLLVGDTVGGQVSYTASVENWLGIPEIGGKDLSEQFRHHAEHYEVDEALGVTVEKITRSGDVFTAVAEDGNEYTGKTVVYCAGKEYRRLGVPGEDRFIGHGIAFCATCDAPLYKDRRVAVVGGGNSAFTAARDLMHWAREIHVINIIPDFQADAVLQEQVGEAGNVTLHPGTTVQRFLGTQKLGGVRLVGAEGKHITDLPVDGVFLEIGLSPNSGPVKDLVELNENGEIVTKRDQSTSVPGFFAAGDVCDEPEKQIIVAAAAGAKAALAADAYLKDGKVLTEFDAKGK